MLQVSPFALLFILPLLAFVGIVRGDLWLWAAPVFAFVALPVLDATVDSIFGPSSKRLEVSAQAHRLGDFILWIYVPVQMALLIFVGLRANSFAGDFGTLAAMAICVGTVTGGIGITIAHELVHRREKLSYGGGLLLLTSVCYGHFAIEHVLGHHAHVATAQDPASARRGENAWRFVARSVVFQFPAAWRIERTRLQRLKLKTWTWHNRLLQTWTCSLIFALGFFQMAGEAGLFFFLTQSFVAVLLLELINYVEHYGLSRKIQDGGKPEPVQLWHSWDSHSRLSGWFLVHLSRHADHHKHPARPFTQLEGSQSSPLLPVGYPASVLLATVPPLWYLVMNPRLDRFLDARGKGAV